MIREFSFHSPVQAILGGTFSDHIARLLAPYRRIAVVTGSRSGEKSGFLEELRQHPRSSDFVFFTEVEENPTIQNIQAGSDFARLHEVDAIVAFGGGSPLDAAKAIALLSKNEGDFYSLVQSNGVALAALPVMAVPGTCGTGSEMNPYAIITDTQTRDKVNLAAPTMYPKAALLEPKFLHSLPELVLLATVYDAFTHALEGFVSLRSQPYSDILAQEAMRIILDGLKLYTRSGVADEELLRRFLYAASLAGIVIGHTGTTILHAWGYYLTNHKGVHHGMANALLLPAYLRLCRNDSVAKIEVVDALIRESGFDLVAFARAHFSQVSVAQLISEQEREEWMAYSIGKKNAQWTPFAVKPEVMLEAIF